LNGKVRWIRSIGMVRYDWDGKPARFDGITIDITNLKAIEEQLREADRRREEFIALLSHELRTPLTSIVGWGALLRQNKVAEKDVPVALETIDRNAQAQLKIVEDLLDTSMIVTNKLRLNKQSLDPVAAVRSAFATIEATARKKKLQLHFTEGPGVGLIVADPGRLQQILLNLLSNSVKFTDEYGKIDVVLNGDDQWVTLSVVDTGRGINSDVIPHIFDRFRQADSSSTRQYGGLGLGLAIVRHLVDLHGGIISASSAGLDRGATFTIRLPRQAAA